MQAIVTIAAKSTPRSRLRYDCEAGRTLISENIKPGGIWLDGGGRADSIGDMIAYLLMLGALTPESESTQITLKAMSFDLPEAEVVILDPAGRPAPVTLYSHALSEPIICRTKEGKLTFFRKPKTADPKEPLVPLASLPAPPENGKYIAILSGAGETSRLSLIADGGGAAAAGTIRFFNLCPQPVGLSAPGVKRVLPSGQEFTVRPQVKAQQYGQAQFFLPGEDGDWRLAGGLRWLQLDDIRSLLFLVPAPGEEGIIKVRGVEERVTADAKKSPAGPVTPASGGEKRRTGLRTLQ